MISRHFLQLVREKNQKEILDTELDSPTRGRLSLNVKLSPLKDGNQSTQGVTIVLNDFTERHENEAMLGVMRRYLPPEMVDNIHQIAGLALGGERRVTTCMFVDVRPLATFPPDLRPPQIMEMLNRYLTLATDCIHAVGGVIDKYMGHEIMGLFNSQLNPADDHAAQALAAGLQIRDAFIDLYRELGINPDPHFYRIGIHSGVATLGNVGSEIRRDFTAIGDTINLSKRLEENATPGQIILSDDTREQIAQTPGVLKLDDIQLVEREPIKVKGRQQLTRIYEVFSIIMTMHDTAKINDLEESTQVYVRQLQQHVNDLSQLLNNQQDLLRKFGMTLSNASQESWLTVGQAVEGFANNRQAAQQELKYLNALADTMAVINFVAGPQRCAGPCDGYSDSINRGRTRLYHAAQ